MKRLALLTLAFTLSYCSFGQRTIPLRNLWAKPEVHVAFQGYTLSFTIKDINRTLELLAEIGDTTFGLSSGLDTAASYSLELLPGTKTEYRNDVQPMLQNSVGTFLLTAGHAYIENSKHKKLTAIIMDIQPVDRGDDKAYILFYDPKGNKLLFSGSMPAEMYKKDLGLD